MEREPCRRIFLSLETTEDEDSRIKPDPTHFSLSIPLPLTHYWMDPRRQIHANEYYVQGQKGGEWIQDT